MKCVIGIYSVFCLYWVGDGFFVCLLFFYNIYGQYLSLFLLLDYVGFYIFVFSDILCGVGQYLYRGFEIVIIVYEGEVVYCDLIGVGGIIGLGDVQWMMVVFGIFYEEFYILVFSRCGGMLDMVQLWVNLLVCDKMGVLGYQILFDVEIFLVDLFDGVGCVWVIVGCFDGYFGLVCIYMLMDVWDICLQQGCYVELLVVEGCMLVLVVLRGMVWINGGLLVGEV